MPKRGKSSTAPTKSQVFSSLAERTGLTKTQIEAVFEALEAEIRDGLRTHKKFKIGTLVKIEVKSKKATAARTMNVAGVERAVPAKPASTRLSVRALKGLKDLM